MSTSMDFSLTFSEVALLTEVCLFGFGLIGYKFLPQPNPLHFPVGLMVAVQS